MRIYLACVGMMLDTYWSKLHPFVLDENGNKKPKLAELRSYWELKWFNGHTLPIYGDPFFLDSGAFSAYSQKQPIKPETYIDFCKKYASQTTIYANLDAIPVNSSQEAKAQAAEISFQNQKAFEEVGLRPLPVFHAGEPWEYLERYLANYDYICLGGLVDTVDLTTFFDEVWSRFLTDSSGKPTHKVHGFGMTAIDHLTKYPWASVDSSSWLVLSQKGLISVPPKVNGEFCYSKKPIILGVSDQTSLKEQRGKHYCNSSPTVQEHVDEYLATMNLTAEDLKGQPQDRFIANINYWLRVEQDPALATSFRRRQRTLL